MNLVRQTWGRVSFWLGVALATLTVANLLNHGLSVELHGLPEIIAKWFRFVFHGIFDLLLGWLPLRVPLWMKDLVSLYVIIGFIILRAMTMQKTVNFMDEVSGGDLEIDTLERLYRFLTFRRGPILALPKGRSFRLGVSRALVVLLWGFVVPYLYWTWTADARLNTAIADDVEQQMHFDPRTRDQMKLYQYLSEKEWEHRFTVYMSVIERDSFAFSISASANLIFLSLIGLFVWSELSVMPV